MPMSLRLPAEGTLTPNDAHDPLPYYYHPWVGWLYRHRLQMGLDLLPSPRFPPPRPGPRPGPARVLEVGVGSGVLVPTLTAHFAEYTGTDLTLGPGLSCLVAPGCTATFRQADLLRDADLPADHFDAVVCFSVLEHIRDADGAARGLARTLKPGGTLVTGYPAVSPLMSRAFEAIGFPGIDDHHVTPPARIHRALAQVLAPVARVAFPPRAPISLALYQCAAWTKG